MATKTYGIGPSTEGPNTGIDVDQKSTLEADGKVIDKNGDVVFDPSEDAIELKDPS